MTPTLQRAICGQFPGPRRFSAWKIARWMCAVQSTLDEGNQPSVQMWLRFIFLQNLVERPGEQVRIVFGEDQRRP
jgi:hypothetical protein